MGAQSTNSDAVPPTGGDHRAEPSGHAVGLMQQLDWQPFIAKLTGPGDSHLIGGSARVRSFAAGRPHAAGRSVSANCDEGGPAATVRLHPYF